MIGAGNVAWHLSQALKKANYIPIGVYSRHKTKAEALAEVLNCRAFDSLDNTIKPADLFFISVKTMPSSMSLKRYVFMQNTP